MGRTAASLFASLAALGCLLMGAGPAVAAPAVNGVFPLNNLGINNKIVAGPDGNMWVTLSAITGKDVARIAPDGQIQEFDLEGVEHDAQGIAPGPDGNLWVPTINEVTRFAPKDPEGTDKTFTIATVAGEGQIVAGPDGNMWVASKDNVDRFNPANPEGDKQNFPVAGLAPKDVDVAGSLIVVADANAQVATFTTAGTQVNFALKGNPQGVAGGPNGQIGFSQQSQMPEEVGTIDPPSQAVGHEIDGDPFGVALGPDGAYWIARSAKAQLIRLTPSGEVTTLSGFPSEYFPRQVAGGPGGTVWVTMEVPGAENATAAVARVTGVEKPSTDGSPVPPPQTKIKKGPKKVVKTHKKKAKVKFAFSSPTAGVSFQCSLTKLKGKKTKVAPFKGCKSPKVYKLRPGRYRFQVRAVNGGVPDPSPAVRKFKIVRVKR